MSQPATPKSFVTWIATVVFAAVAFIVLIAFEPTRAAICAPYRVEGVGVLLAMVGGTETGCLRGLLYDFQTLVTGVLALGAAAYTVQRMQKDDLNASMRHLQQLQLARRPDRLRLEKHMLPWLPKFRDVLGVLRQLTPKNPWAANNLKDGISEYLEAMEFYEYHFGLNDLRDTLIGEGWTSINDLLDYPIIRLREQILDMIPECYAAATALLVVNRDERPSLPPVEEAQNHHYARLIDYVEASEKAEKYPELIKRITDMSAELYSRLKTLLLMYDVEVS